MASNRTLLKIALVIAALIVASTVIATSPIEAKSQNTQWTWNGGSGVGYGYPWLSPSGDLVLYSTNGTLYTLSPQGSQLRNSSLLLTGMPQFSADGTMFALVSTSANTVNGTKLIVISPTGSVKWNHSIAGIAMGMNVLPDGGAVLGIMPTSAGQVKLECLNSDGSTRWTKGGYDATELGSMMYPIGIHGNNVMVSSTMNATPDTAVIFEYLPDGTQLRTFNTDFAPFSIFFALDGTMRTVGYQFTHNTDYEALYCLSNNGSAIWRRAVSNLYGDIVVLTDGTTVYAERSGSISLSLTVYSVDRNGDPLWQLSNADSVPVVYKGNTLVSNSVSLMLVSHDGKVIWSIDGLFYGQPVVKGNTIYAGTSSGLSAITDSAWNLTWQPAVLMLTIVVAIAGIWLLSGRTPKL